jgi:photosystem II stability/assembly factor-like uncharacterized protein
MRRIAAIIVVCAAVGLISAAVAGTPSGHIRPHGRAFGLDASAGGSLACVGPDRDSRGSVASVGDPSGYVTHAIDPSGQSAPADGDRLYATVFLVRGSVVGSKAGHFGPFLRLQDTLWQRLSLSDVYSFRFGRFANAKTHRLYLAAGNGLHRSTDGGATWRILTGWQSMEVLSVLPDPADSTLIYVATPWGIFRSTDDGATWQARMQGMRRWFVRDIQNELHSSRSLLAVAEDDVYRSNDRGEQWTPLGLARGHVLGMLQHPVRRGLLLVSVEEGGILRSTNGGQQWVETSGLEGTSVYTLAGSPDGSELYAAGWETGLWRSVDDGATWSKVWDAPGIDAIFSFLVDPRDSAHLFAGTDGNGLFESFDHAVHWQWAGLRGGKIKHIVMYPNTSGSR